MREAIAWLNANNGSVQAVSTVVLVVVTAWYSAKMARLTAAATEPNVRVTLRWGFHTPSGLDVLILTATNTGQMPVKVTQPFLKLPDGRQMVTFSFDYVDTPRDSKLYAGDTASYHLSFGKVARGLLDQGYKNNQSIRAGFHDQFGNTYLSNAQQVDPVDWAARP